MLEQIFLTSGHFIESIRWTDILDLMLVWLIVYRILLLIRKTGTMQMLSGLGILAICYIISIWFELLTFNWILERFFSNLFLIVVVLFQAEIRRALAQIGTNPFLSEVSHVRETQVIEEVVQACYQIAEKGWGALIVIEREISIDYHVEIGTELDSKVSTEILLSIFHPNGPLHDGAVIVRGGKIYSAGTFLPLSKNPILDKNLGTRHRAALGLTEETDAMVIVISEESKSVGIAQGGQLKPQLNGGLLRQELYEFYGLVYRGADR